jgi:hypothetical protein
MRKYEKVMGILMVTINESEKELFNSMPVVYNKGLLWVSVVDFVNTMCSPLKINEAYLSTYEYKEVDGEHKKLLLERPILTMYIADKVWNCEKESGFRQEFDNYKVTISTSCDEDGQPFGSLVVETSITL